MRILDQRGRVFGLINLIDLAVVAGIVLLVMAAYVKLSAPYRVAPVLITPENRLWVDVELHLPSGQEWLVPYLDAGAEEIDPRSGEVIGKLLQAQTEAPGEAVVKVRLMAAKDAQGRLIRGGEPLVPGRELTVTTDRCIVKGTVGRIALADGT